MIRFLLSFVIIASSAWAVDRPNILWITCEDSSPHLGCYGDPNANTPNLDALAARGMRYQRAWSNAPVCAPARTCIISGRWAPSDGAEHMRSQVPLPQGHKLFPQYLREAGYYCTNNSKEDYNLIKPEGVWDDSSAKAHWKNRKDGQPFFAVFNDQITHESQIRATPHTLVHDPAKVVLPLYMPDAPEIRRDWAQHFDNVTTMDGHAATLLKELEKAGLAEDTIVFFYSDHGTGMARSKRWPYDSGLRVPFIVYFPKKWQHLAPKEYQTGGVSERLISFIDLAPTVLSLAGIKAPDYLQGRAFAGEHGRQDTGYAFGFRGRMDERVDCVRSITNGRFVYMRQFMPHLPYGQHVNYMFEQASTRAWHDLYLKGGLSKSQQAFWQDKPSEELYDLAADPEETNNLAADPAHRQIKQELAQALQQWLIDTRDLGIVSEAQRLSLSRGTSPADAFADEQVLPYKEVLQAAMQSSDRSLSDPAAMLPLLQTANAQVRYWGAMGTVARGEKATKTNRDALLPLLADQSPSVRVAAAEALARFGAEADQAKAWEVLLKGADAMQGSAMEATEALNAIDRAGEKAKAYKGKIAALPVTVPAGEPERLREYPSRLIEYMAGTLGYAPPAKAKPNKGKKGKAKSE